VAISQQTINNIKLSNTSHS